MTCDHKPSMRCKKCNNRISKFQYLNMCIECWDDILLPFQKKLLKDIWEDQPDLLELFTIEEIDKNTDVKDMIDLDNIENE